MTYFQDVKTIGDAKSLYRKLAKQYHPDLHGRETTEAMQQVNAEYHHLLESFDGVTSIGSDNKEHTYHYRRETEQAVMDKVVELLKLDLPGCQIEIVGTWVWVSGNTKPVKDKLGKNGAGLSWHSKRKRWYWHLPTFRRKYSGVDFDTLRFMYGSRTFEADEQAGGMVAA